MKTNLMNDEQRAKNGGLTDVEVMKESARKMLQKVKPKKKKLSSLNFPTEVERD